MARILTLFSCVLIFLPICYSQENLALHKPAYQSGVWDGRGADRAVDGVTSGRLTNCAHTNAQPGTNAWWYVDLEEMYKVQDITIYYRGDNDFPYRRKFSRLSVGPSLSNLTICREFGEAAAPNPGHFACDLVGRFVLWERTGGEGTQYMTLCEVQVSGYKWIRNIALNKPTFQSGDYENPSADRAVDGVTSGLFTNCAHPDAPLGMNAWWVVDLEDVYRVQRIIVYFRGDESYAYSRKFSRLSIGTSLSDMTTCKEFGEEAAPDPGYFELDLEGRFVQWERMGGKDPNVFTLCEIQVWILAGL